MSYSQSAYLTILTHAPADAVKTFVEEVIPHLGDIEVLINRTGLVMLPYTDTSTGTRFHLGEALVSEAHVRIGGGVEGYAVCVGRDLQQALVVALLDAALTADIMTDTIHTFIADQEASQQAADEQLLKQVEATRIEMETLMTFPLYTPAEAQSRETFLALMWALSYPGRVHRLPENVHNFTLIAETLLDLETSYFSPDEPLQAMLVTTGAHARPSSDAAYHFYEQVNENTLTDIRQASVGTMLYPDTATTLVIGCSLNNGTEFVLSGPGVNGQQAVQINYLPHTFWQLRETACKYPLGWDVFLVDGQQVIGLPRSTRMERI